MSWKTEIQQLDEPFVTWLSSCEFYITDSNTGVLVVEDESLVDLYSSLEVLTRAYEVAKRIHPPLQSFIVVSGSIYDLLKTNDVELHDIKFNVKD